MWRVPVVGKIPIGLVYVCFCCCCCCQTTFFSFCDFVYVVYLLARLPGPRLPPASLWTGLIGDAFTIALVSFALNMSMVKYFAKKHQYETNSNQELFSSGLGNVVSALFGGFPSGGGLTRSLVMESTGGKTQMFSIISSAIVLVVILGLGFLFEALPKCCLAAIITQSLLRKCIETRRIVTLFRKSKLEAV